MLDADPEERIVREDAPSSLKLRFNEPVEHALAFVTIYNRKAEPVFSGQPTDDVERSPMLEFSLPQLEEGTYTVKWDVVSADGHPVSGSYIFAIGHASKDVIKSSSSQNTFDSLLIIIRYITQGLLMLSAGLYWFAWLAEQRKFPNAIDLLSNRMTLTLIFLLILGTIGEFVIYVYSLPPGILTVLLNGRLDLLQQFPFILMVLVQLILLFLLIIPEMVRGWYLFIWFALAITPAFGGHVWGLESPYYGLILRILHQLSIAFWLGALLFIIIMIVNQRISNLNMASFRKFFVGRMIFATSMLVISGFLMVVLQTGVLVLFNDIKTWNLLLLLKIILTVLMLIFALVQTLKWKKTHHFTSQKLVKIEWVIGVCIVGLGIWMSQIVYPVSIASYDESFEKDNIQVALQIEKLEMGDQTLKLSFNASNNETPENIEVKITMPQHEMESGLLDVTEKDSNYFVDLPFSMSGTWEIQLFAEFSNGKTFEWKDEIYIANNQ